MVGGLFPVAITLALVSRSMGNGVLYVANLKDVVFHFLDAYEVSR
jgi:hypothetical protein